MPSNFKALAGASGGEPIDANFKNVTLLLHGDGSNGAQNNTFLDSSTNNFTITRNGNTTQGSFSPYGSNWSNYFDGSGDYLSVADNAAFGYGTGDFTIEFWLFANATSSQTVVSNLSGVSSTNPHIYIDGTIRYYTAGADRITGATIAAGQWYHIALCRSSGSTKLFINGTQSGATYSDANNYGSSAPIGVGTYWSGGSPVATTTVNGYLSNVRVVKGTALYTGTFTPPTQPLTAISGTSLLTCAYNRFRDASTNNFTITRNGDVKVTNFAPFAPSSAYSTTTNGGSAYFDGNDYVDVASNTAFDLSGDFTIEFWVNTTRTADSWVTGYYVSNPSNTNQTAYCVIIFGGNYLLNLVSGSTETIFTIGSAASISNGAWNHIACTRSGNTVRTFVNGVLSTTTTYSSTLNNPAGAVYRIGGFSGTFEDPFAGYISNLRVVKGTAVYTAAFTPPSSPVIAITNTSLLTNFTNAAIFDNSMKNDLETVGNAQISTSVKKFGTGSMAFDGSGDYIRTIAKPEFGFGTGNFTVELWVYSSSFSSVGTLVDFRSAPVAEPFALSISATGLARTYDGSSVRTGGQLNAAAWNHVAWVRSSNVNTVYVNGTSGHTWTATQDFGSSKSVTLGYDPSGSFEPFTGYIDDLRITKGIVRYTANFTPPTAAFANK